MSVMKKEMEKYRDIDEDELLKKLSEEELQRLEDELEELDPDVSLQPFKSIRRDCCQYVGFSGELWGHTGLLEPLK